MHSTKTILDAVLKFYDAGYSSDSWTEALDAMASLTDAKGLLMYAVSDEDALGYNIAGINSFFKNNLAKIAEFEDIFGDRSRYHLGSEWLEYMSNVAVYSPVYDSDIWSPEAFNAHPEAQWIRDNFGLQRRFFLDVSNLAELRAGLIFHYDQTYLSPLDKDVESASQVVRHFGKAIEIFKFWSPMRQKYDAVLAVLDNIELGICIANENGDVILANQFANDLFDVRDGIWLGKDNEFRCRSDDELQRLKAAMDTIGKTSVGKNNATELQINISRSSGDDPVLAIVSPLRDAEAELENGLTGCMVTLIDTKRSSHARLQAFAAAHKLTRAESEVAARMLDGSSATEIAEIRGVANSTIVSQVKSILSKVRAKNRVQFVWRVFQFAPPIK